MIASIAETLLWTAVSNSVVGLGLAVLAIAAARLLKSPAVAHCLWVLVLLKLLTPPLFEIAVPLPELPASHLMAIDSWLTEPAEPIETVPVGADQNTAMARALNLDGPTAASTDWLGFGFTIWWLGALLAGSFALYRAARFHRGLRHARPASNAVRDDASRLARRLGLRRTPVVRIIPGKLSPMLWGFFGRAQVLLPEILERTLTPDQKRTLLAHELAHLQRRDHWVRVLELVVRAIYWWNPLAIWACRELRIVEEECCDAWVVWALPDASHSYAHALIDTAEFLSDAPDNTPAPASGIGKATNLKRRLIMIMQGENHTSRSHGSLSRLGRVAVFGLAAIALPLVPAIAQDRHLGHDRHEAKSKSQDVHKEQVLRALKHAISLLTKNHHGEDAEILTVLMKKVRGSNESDHKKHVALLHQHLQTLAGIEQHMHDITDHLHDAEKHGDHSKAGQLRKQMQELKAHASMLHIVNRNIEKAEHQAGFAHERARATVTLERERSRAEERRAKDLAMRARDVARAQKEQRASDIALDRETHSRASADHRIQHLEAKVDKLTQAVERLLERRETKRETDPEKGSKSRKGGRDRREVDPMTASDRNSR